MLAFQHQDSEQTLSQGMAEYFAAHPGLLRKQGMSAEAAEFFRCHDVAHVVFGCAIGLDDEAAVKIASIMGTTAGLGVLGGYRLHESFQIYRQLPLPEVLLSIVRSVGVVPLAAFRCCLQKARWPWADHQRYMPVRLCELRREFGIRVAHRHSG